MWFGILCRKVKKHQGIVNDLLGYSDKTKLKELINYQVNQNLKDYY